MTLFALTVYFLGAVLVAAITGMFPKKSHWLTELIFIAAWPVCMAIIVGWIFIDGIRGKR